MTFARLSTLSLTLFACAGPSPGAEGSDTEQSAESTGGEALDPCESPVDDLGFGLLDRNMDGELTLDDLEPGEAAVQAVWTDDAGVKTVWRQVSTTANIWHGDALGDQSRYGVWLPLTDPQVDQPLYTTAVFEGPQQGISEPASFARVSSHWDIAYLERGGSNEDEDGSVVLSHVEGDVASGTVSDPSGPIEIIDYLAQAPSGDVVCVQRIVFREISAEFTH